MNVRKPFVWAAAMLLLLPSVVFADPYADLKFTVPDVPPAYTGKTNADLKNLVEVPYYSFKDDPALDPVAAYAAEIRFQYEILKPHKDAWDEAQKTDPKAPRSYLSKEELAAYMASWDRVAKYLSVTRSEWENIPADTNDDYANRLKIIVDKFAYKSISGVYLFDGTTFKNKDLKDADWDTDLAEPLGFYGYFPLSTFDEDTSKATAIALQRMRRIDFYGFTPVAESLMTSGTVHIPHGELFGNSFAERINPNSIDLVMNKLATDLDKVLTRDQKLAIRARLLKDIFAGAGLSEKPDDFTYRSSNGVVYRPFQKNSWWPAKDALDTKINPNAQDKD